MILSPFLNRLIKSLTKEKFVGLLILVLVIWSIIPTFIGIKSFDINDLVWFVVLYIIGTFIRLHIDIPKLNILMLFSSILLLLIFLRRKSFSNRYINYISGSVFGICMIHDNILLRKYIWDGVFSMCLLITTQTIFLL